MSSPEVTFLHFPAPAPWINANGRRHYHAQAALTRVWREAAALHGRNLKPLQRAHIIITFAFPDRRRRDVGNLYPTAKALVDGLIDAGLLPDDSDRYLIGPDLRCSQQLSKPYVAISISALPDGKAA